MPRILSPTELYCICRACSTALSFALSEVECLDSYHIDDESKDRTYRWGFTCKQCGELVVVLTTDRWIDTPELIRHVREAHPPAARYMWGKGDL